MRNKLFTLICVALIAASCSKFLDVNPKGEVFDADMFTTQEGYEDALYGIYAELGTVQYLYSDFMYWLPEVLSGNETISDNALQYMAIGQWSAFNANAIRNGMWRAGYSVINHLNNIIAHIEKGGEDEFQLSPIFLGEALGLRAMLHFDLMRFYGPASWAPAEKLQRAIPYVQKYSFSITPYSSYTDVYKYIIADLKRAEELLVKDEEFMTPHRDNSTTGGFSSCRIIHMNLYAVQALLARVYWTLDDLDSAAEYARKVIESGLFRFRQKSAFIQYDNGTLDLNETIFGIASKVSNSSNVKKYGLTGTSSSFMLASDWRALYEDGSSLSGTDYRLGAWFDGSHLRYMVNSSYIDGSTDYQGSSILGVNILRLSELYYIMAESLLSSDPDAATIYYDEAVTTRGLDALAPQGKTVTNDILYKERRKEFYGEGLHWHDMKRLAIGGTDMNAYTMPIPTEEDARRDE